MSPLLPWLAILALLGLKPNRGWSAWWIWLPLLVLAAGSRGLGLVLQNADTGLRGEALEILSAVPAALTFGLAALWLLAFGFGRGRFRTFSGSLVVLVVFTCFSFSATVGWNVGKESIMSLIDPRHCSDTASAGELALPFLVLPVLVASVVAVAMALSGLACRRRRRAWRLGLWLCLSLAIVWMVAAELLYYPYRQTPPGFAHLDVFFWLGAVAVPTIFVTLLPFLILSWANALFRERLKALLHLESQKPIPHHTTQEQL